MKRKIIITNNKEIYEKLNMLHFSPEVVVKNVKKMQLNRIIKNINKEVKILDTESIGEYIVIKRLNPINFAVYLNK